VPIFHRRRLSYLASLGVVLSTSTVAAMTVAAPISLASSVPKAVTLADPLSPCGATGVLSGSGPFVCTYTTTGSDTFTVPNGVGSVDLVVVGAQGGHYFIAGDAAHGGSPAGDITGRPGGNGGQATGTLAGLTSGQVLQVDVAGKGANGTAASRSGGMMNGPSGGQGALGGFGGSNGGMAGGPGDANGANGGTAFNGGNGSGGGGSSDVRSVPGGCAALTCALSDRVLVGGGGGGGGTGGQGNALGGAGGDGGGTNGADGAPRSMAATVGSRAPEELKPQAGSVGLTPRGMRILLPQSPTIRVSAVMALTAPPASAASVESGTSPATVCTIHLARIRTLRPPVVERVVALGAGTSVVGVARAVGDRSAAAVVAVAAPSPQQPSHPRS
jgi:hypothetical protein